MKFRPDAIFRPRRTATAWILLLPLLGGCAMPADLSVEWQSNADREVSVFSETAPSQPWECRLLDESALPPHSTRHLNESVCLIMVQDPVPSNVAAVLDPSEPPPADSSGRSSRKWIGLVLRCGEPTDGRWPLHIFDIRRRGRLLSIHARTRPGVFLPVDAPGFVTLIEVKSGDQPYLIELDNQRFVAEGD